MRISYITIFPEVYDSFLQTSLIKKAIDARVLQCECINPRQFSHDKHHTVDDEIYGGGAGMLMKAQPMIDAVRHVISTYGLLIHPDDDNTESQCKTSQRIIVFMSPSVRVFDQRTAYELAEHYDHIIIVSGRYEGIDARFEEFCCRQYVNHFQKISLGSYITLGGELPSMVMTEAIVRLLPGVIGQEESHRDESYAPTDDPSTSMTMLEYPQYTRPEEVEGMCVPEVLLSGNHAHIEAWREANTLHIGE